MSSTTQQFNEESTPEQRAIGAITFSILFAIVFVFVHYRVSQRHKALKSIPRKEMKIIHRNLSKPMAAAIEAEYLRSVSTKVDPSPFSAWQEGWGKPNSDYRNVHFKTAISLSYLILEKAAVHKNPGLKRSPQQSIRDYVYFLQQHCPGFNQLPCKSYIDAYERARYSNDEFTINSYNDFMKHFFALLQYFEND